MKQIIECQLKIGAYHRDIVDLSYMLTKSVEELLRSNIKLIQLFQFTG